MDATTYELRSILVNERRFLIPTFQRDYEWTESGQWALLFDDLVSTANRLAGARAHAELTGESSAKAEKRVAPHFLGAVVLDQLPSKAGQLDRRAVIDGQQRLTTIQLLIRALADVAAETGSPRTNQLRRLIFNPLDDPTAEPDEKYKLWPRRHDRDVWRAAMDDDPAGNPTSHLYGKARTYFAQRARDATSAAAASADVGLATVGPDDAPDRIAPDGGVVSGIDTPTAEIVDFDTLVDAATGLFKLVSIDLDDNDDAQVIFEVLNGRQTALSAADLVKNLLFLRAEVADEEELQDLHDKYWAPLETDWWKTSIGRGHAARQRRELLLAAWLTVQQGTEASVGHLYGEIRHYIADRDRKVHDVLGEIASFASSYRRIALPNPSVAGRRTAEAYQRINLLGVTTAQPLLLWLDTLPPDLLRPAQREAAVVAVESWIVRRLLAKRNTRGYSKVLIGAMNEGQAAVATGAPDGQLVVSRIIDGLDDEKLTWPDDGELIDMLVRERFYDFHSKERVRMVLAAIDVQLAATRPKSERLVVDYDKLQIEHLMPQSWSTHWPLPDDVTDVDSATRTRNTSGQSLGNLTLLTAVLNPSLSNGPWSLKRPEIWAHSKLQLNSGLGADTDSWNEAAIAARGRSLTDTAIEIWPSADRLRALLSAASG